jgi:hypothetical protein
MAKRDEKQNRPGRRSGKSIRGSLIALFVFAAIIASVVAIYFLSGKRTSPDASVEATVVDPQALKGRWLRPDGGYVLEIRSVAGDGRMEAGYFNPGPIRVSKAEASRTGSTLNVFVELRDTGYPGSTYTMIYDPREDSLKGVYYQAAIRESFDIIFLRMK